MIPDREESGRVERIGLVMLLLSLAVAGILFYVSGSATKTSHIDGWGENGLSPFFVVGSVAIAVQGVIIYFAFKVAAIITAQLEELNMYTLSIRGEAQKKRT